MFDGMHDGWMWGMHWGWWVFWILVIVGVVWLITQIQQDRAAPPSSPGETPLETLQRRYAEGQITSEEYYERRQRLERDR